MEESFTLEEFETSQIDELATLPNVDQTTTCKCRGHCLREKGRNVCLCKSINKYCSTSCHDGGEFSSCMNNRRVHESDSDESELDYSAVSRALFILCFYSTMKPQPCADKVANALL